MKGWLRIGLAEARRQGTRVDPKVMAVLAALGLAVGALFVIAAPPAPSPEDGMWIIEAEADAYYRPAAEHEDRIRIIDGDGTAMRAGTADLFLTGRDIQAIDSERARAAAEVLGAAHRDWLDDQLALEADQAAAFPLTITVVYEARDVGAEPAPPPDAPPARADTPPDPADEEDILEDVEPVGEVQQDIRPDEVDPPFPIRSLLLTFAYVLPAGLLAQVQAANLHGERTRHRGVMLLSAPVTARDILIGKSLPAFAATIAIGAIVTVALGAGWLGFLASLSFLAFLYSATTYLAVISRSPRELSLSQVAVTTLLNVFLFLPAMFPSIAPVAFLSPVHVVASGIRGDPVTIGQFLYATLPLSLAAFALAAMSVGLMREELLFSVRSSVSRFLDALSVMTRKSWRVLVAGILVVPFVFAGEIMILVTSAVMGLRAAFIVYVPMSVVVEEVAKGLPIWANRRGPKRLPPWALAILVGTGFFLGEKSYLVLTLVGFETLPFGREALALLGTGPGFALLMIPLAIHIITAMCLAYGSHFGGKWSYAGFAVAAIIHLVWDQVLLGGFV